MKPEWVMVIIAVVGFVFHAGIGWATLAAIRREMGQVSNTQDEHAMELARHGVRLDEHGRRIGHLERGK